MFVHVCVSSCLVFLQAHANTLTPEHACTQARTQALTQAHTQENRFGAIKQQFFTMCTLLH